VNKLNDDDGDDDDDDDDDKCNKDDDDMDETSTLKRNITLTPMLTMLRLRM